MAAVGFIYALADPNTGAIRYCGKTVRRMNHRLNAHRQDATRGVNRHVRHWLRPIFAAGKEPEVLICEEIDFSGLPRDQQLVAINEAEIRWIAQLKALGCSLTNATDGGDGCHGRVLSDRHVEILRASNAGRTVSQETKDRISKAKIGIASNPTGPSNPCYGRRPNWKDPEARARKLRGGNNPNASIGEEIAQAIFLAKGSNPDIAARFNSTVRVVQSIRGRSAWRHATDQLIRAGK